MDHEGIRTRLSMLRQKTRKALGFYKKMARGPSSPKQEIAELQMAEWREVTGELLEKLVPCIEETNVARASQLALVLRDGFNEKWRSSEAAVHIKQKDLVRAADRGDFVKAAILSQELVRLRAQQQASQAAYNELCSVLSRSRYRSDNSLTHEFSVPEPSQEVHLASNVIPLRRQR